MKFSTLPVADVCCGEQEITNAVDLDAAIQLARSLEPALLESKEYAHLKVLYLAVFRLWWKSQGCSGADVGQMVHWWINPATNDSDHQRALIEVILDIIELSDESTFPNSARNDLHTALSAKCAEANLNWSDVLEELRARTISLQSSGSGGGEIVKEQSLPVPSEGGEGKEKKSPLKPLWRPGKTGCGKDLITLILLKLGERKADHRKQKVKSSKYFTCSLLSLFGDLFWQQHWYETGSPSTTPARQVEPNLVIEDDGTLDKIVMVSIGNLLEGGSEHTTEQWEEILLTLHLIYEKQLQFLRLFRCSLALVATKVKSTDGIESAIRIIQTVRVITSVNYDQLNADVKFLLQSKPFEAAVDETNGRFNLDTAARLSERLENLTIIVFEFTNPQSLDVTDLKGLVCLNGCIAIREDMINGMFSVTAETRQLSGFEKLSRHLTCQPPPRRVSSNPESYHIVWLATIIVHELQHSIVRNYARNFNACTPDLLSRIATQPGCNQSSGEITEKSIWSGLLLKWDAPRDPRNARQIARDIICQVNDSAPADQNLVKFVLDNIELATDIGVRLDGVDMMTVNGAIIGYPARAML